MKITAAATSFALYAGIALASAPEPGPEWTNTLLLDDFSGGAGSPPSTANWIIRTGTQYSGGPAHWGTDEVETYTASSDNLEQSGKGDLIITPRNSNGAWTSGRIESQSDEFAAPAGGKLRIEASISIPDVTSRNGVGYWPAFWLLGQSMRSNYSSWPAPGEIDIMENINGQDNITQGLHCDVNPGGACNEPVGLGHDDSCSGGRCAGGFHTYGIIVDRSVSPEQLQFYLDQKLQYTVTETKLGSDVWAETMHQGFYIILNVAIGGSYANAVYGKTTPTSWTESGQQMAVDYVAVWTT